MNRIIISAAACLTGMAAVAGINTTTSSEMQNEESCYALEYRDVMADGDRVFTVDPDLDRSYILTEYLQPEDGIYSGHKQYSLKYSKQYLSLAKCGDRYLFTGKRAEVMHWMDKGVMYEYKYDSGKLQGIFSVNPPEFIEATSQRGDRIIEQIRLYQPHFGSQTVAAQIIDNMGEGYLMISDDFGGTWRTSDTDVVFAYIQWAPGDRSVVYGVMPYAGKSMILMASDDSGMTWSVLDEIPYHYNSAAPSIKESNIAIDVCPSDPSLVVVSCATPFVYDRTQRKASFIASAPDPVRLPGNLEDVCNSRRYGFTDSAVPQLMTFDDESAHLILSDDLGATWRVCLDRNDKPAYAGTVSGWTRVGNMVYAMTKKYNKTPDETIIRIDLRETDAMAGVAVTSDDPATGGVRVTVSAGSITVQSDNETDIAVYADDGRTVIRREGVRYMSHSVTPGVYVVQAGGLVRKVAVD